MIKAGEIEELIEKFTGDITEKEADKIYALFSKSCRATKMNPASSKVDVGLLRAFRTWFTEVKKAIDEGRTGMFLSTVSLDYDRSFTEKLNPLDRVRRFGAYGSFREKLPKELKGQTFFSEINRAGWLRRYSLYDSVASMKVSLPAGEAINPEVKIRGLSGKIIDKPDDLIGILFSLSVNRLNIPCVSLAFFPGLSSEKFLLPEQIDRALKAVKNEWEPIRKTLITSGVLRAYKTNDKKDPIYCIDNRDFSSWETGVSKFIDIFEPLIREEELINTFNSVKEKENLIDECFEIER